MLSLSFGSSLLHCLWSKTQVTEKLTRKWGIFEEVRLYRICDCALGSQGTMSEFRRYPEPMAKSETQTPKRFGVNRYYIPLLLCIWVGEFRLTQNLRDPTAFHRRRRRRNNLCKVTKFTHGGCARMNIRKKGVARKIDRANLEE